MTSKLINVILEEIGEKQTLYDLQGNKIVEFIKEKKKEATMQEQGK